MSKINAFLSKGSRIDDVVGSACRTAIFARMARKGACTPQTLVILAITGIFIAVVMFVSACALFLVAVNQYGLDVYGIETAGTVTDRSLRRLTDVSHRTYSPDNKTEWETIDTSSRRARA